MSRRRTAMAMVAAMVATSVTLAGGPTLVAVAAPIPPPIPLDPTFGAEGVVDLGGDTSSPIATPVATVDAGGRLIVVGAGGTHRVLPDGTVDPTFSAAPLRNGARSVTVLDDGTVSILAIDGDAVRIDRLTSTGAPASYGTDGTLRLSGMRRALQRSDGTALVPTSPGGVAQLLAFDPAGAPDEAIAPGGAIVVGCSCAGPHGVAAEALAPDGTTLVLVTYEGGGDVVRLARDGAELDRAVLSGEIAGAVVAEGGGPTWVLPTPDGGAYVVASRGFAAAKVAHLAAGLEADAGFGTGGVVTAPNAARGEPLVVGGRLYVPYQHGSIGSGVLAIDGEGIDTSFGDGGTVTTTPLAISSYMDVTVQVRLSALENGGLLAATEVRYCCWFFGYGTAAGIDHLSPDGEVLGTQEWVGRGVADGRGGAFLLLHSSGRRVARAVPSSSGIGAVRDLGFEVQGSQATVTWAAPAGGADPSGYYQVSLQRPSTSTQGPVQHVQATTTSVDLGTLSGVSVLDVRATGPDGLGAAHAGPVVLIAHHPSVRAYVDRIRANLGMGPLSPAALATIIEALVAGEQRPGTVALDQLRAEPWRSRAEPLVRLYWAYFRRIPDPGGLRYWVGRRAAGVSVARISAQFAGSSEFVRTYGALSNRAFVELVYENVLGRAGDAGGVAYWTGRLDRNVTSRGQLMASFSESSEHVRRRSGLVLAVSAYWGMLERVPTPAEALEWQTGQANDTDMDLLLLGKEYREVVAPD